MVVVVAAAPACGGEAGDAPTEIEMLDNTFSPEIFEVAAGEPVRFVNGGAVPHNAIALDGSWSTEDAYGDLLMPSGEAAELVIEQPGEYPFFCSLHATQDADGNWQGMTGTLVVGEPDETRTATAASVDAPSDWSGQTRAVPADYPTIQSAVDAAEPGDLVLVQPGTYREAVLVTTPGLVIRGVDRNQVILDGELTRTNGIHVTADGVAIENMTARNFTVNGFFWDGVTGYRGSYLTAIDDWVYGIYAFDSVDGVLEHSYASGSWDAGFYIGQCDPCDAVVTDVLAEFNGLGYSGTNSSGNIFIVNSEWRHNIAGIAPNTLDSELLPPVHDVVVAGNYIHDNGELERAPSGSFEWAGWGNGVMLAGARDSVVRDNLIVNNPSAGVLVFSMIDANLWRSGGNEVRDNVIRGSGRADLALGGPLEQGSCIAGNEASSTIPMLARALHSCDGINVPLWWGWAAPSEPLGRLIEANFDQNPQLEHGEAPDPELTFEQLPGGADAPVVPAVNVFASLDFDPTGVTLPDVEIGESDERRLVLAGVALGSGVWPVVVGGLVWWVPLVVWLLGGLWAVTVVWRSERSLIAKLVWSAVLAFLPVLGLALYVLIGHRRWRVRRRTAVVAASAVLWLGSIVAIFMVGGLI